MRTKNMYTKKDVNKKKFVASRKKQTKGITLIALVITIIVLLILAGVTINLTLGEDGIIKKAEQAGKNYVDAQNAEQEQLAELTNELDSYFEERDDSKGEALVTRITLNKTETKIVVDGAITITATIEPSNATNSKLIWSSSDESIATVNELGVVTGVGKGKATITATAADGSGVTASCSVEVTTFIGYYADVDNDGTVDGVIFADMLTGGSGTWVNADGTWEIEKTSNTKKYVISQASYTGKFGTAPVLQANGDGNDRFYVMELNDLDSITHCWYDSAYSNGISNYETVTSLKFGQGKTNTKTMISKWNSTAYGSQNGNTSKPDVWGVVQEKYNSKNEWFVPSKEEWSAFGSAFNITSSNYNSTYGLNGYYWSSSICYTNGAWCANFYNGCMSGGYIHVDTYVRLCATF